MLEYRVDVKVEWGHCDPAQIVYNPNFFDWMERGVTGLVSAAGFELAELMAADPNFRGTPLVRSDANFLSPAALDDVVTVASRVTRFGRSSFDIAHDFYLGGGKIIEATQTRVWSGVDPQTGKLSSLPIPQDVKDALSQDRIVHFRLTAS